LLALCGKTIDQERKVEVAALSSDALAFGLQARKLIVEQELALVEQASNQRGLAVIDTAAGDESKKVLIFLTPQVGIEGQRRILH
jgi:hypothetical protein